MANIISFTDATSLAHSYASAFTTRSLHAVLALKEICILWRVLVTTGAVVLLAIVFTPLQVLLMRYGFQMPGINTSSISAQVVKFQTFWHRAVNHFVGYAMSHSLHAWFNSKSSVALLVTIPSPYPTGRLFINLQPKAFLPSALHTSPFVIGGI